MRCIFLSLYLNNRRVHTPERKHEKQEVVGRVNEQPKKNKKNNRSKYDGNLKLRWFYLNTIGITVL